MHPIRPSVRVSMKHGVAYNLRDWVCPFSPFGGLGTAKKVGNGVFAGHRQSPIPSSRIESGSTHEQMRSVRSMTGNSLKSTGPSCPYPRSPPGYWKTNCEPGTLGWSDVCGVSLPFRGAAND